MGKRILIFSFIILHISLAYNSFAFGDSPKNYPKGKLFEGMQTKEERKQVDAAIQKFPALIRAVFESLQGVKRTCNCPDALRRYKDKGSLP